MKKLINNYLNISDVKDKILIIIFFLFPFGLSMSIFIVDLLASIAGLILIYIFVFKINFINFIEPIKKQVYIFLLFFVIILFSLFFSNDFEYSFLPSFFYFRYFLVSLGIFYLFKKYNFMNHIFLTSLLLCFFLVACDSLIQYIFLQNIFGYNLPNFTAVLSNQNVTRYVTSFFDQEKKLGSYVIRLLPFLISLTLLHMPRKFYLDKIFIFIAGILIFFTTERTGLFLYIIFIFFYFLIFKNKIYKILFILASCLILFQNNPNFVNKYYYGTLTQFGVYEWGRSFDQVPIKYVFKKNENFNLKKLNYYSVEHENLVFTGFSIFKRNILTGSGIKTFYNSCNNLRKIGLKFYINDSSYNWNRRNYLKCSTHPHSTYIQLLSDTGIFSFLIIAFIFFNVLYMNLKILYFFLRNRKIKTVNNELIAYYIINSGILISIFPLVPSGNFFNNWLSLITFYPLGYWLYLHSRVKNLV